MSTRYRRDDQVRAKALDDELVVLHLGTGEYFVFNEAAGRIWEMLVCERSQDFIVDGVLREFVAPRDEVERHCQQVLSRMSEHGLVNKVG